jgi:methyl-accepting chemotaxis protein
MFNRIKAASLTTKVVSLALALLIVTVVTIFTVFISGYSDSAREGMVAKAAAFTAVADETKNHVSRLSSNGSFDHAKLLGDLQAQRDADPGYDYRDSDIYQTIPVVSGWTAAREAAQRENVDFRIVAFDARNPDNEPSADPVEGAFRADLLRELEETVASGGEQWIQRENPETNTLHYMRAIRLDSTCLTCHGDAGHPVGDPDGDGQDPVGFAMEGWKAGDTHGAYEIVFPLEPLQAQVAGFVMRGVAWTVPIAVAGVAMFVFFLSRTVTRPVQRLVSTISQVATGDLTARTNVTGGDEIGSVSRSFDTFVETLHGMITNVSGVTASVSAAATEIAANAEHLAAGMRDQQDQTTQVAAAVNEMTNASAEVARQSASASRSADDSGQAASSGGEVVKQTVEEMEAIAAQVVESASAVSELGQRSQEIGKVIEVISEIADQTNLLALNAAIEAARAGEHGRGFAVVADEVRKLAERTQQATEEVTRSIGEIQGETDDAVSAIEVGTKRVETGVSLANEAGGALERILTSTQELGRMISDIAAAAEQQSATSEEIASSIEKINGVTQESVQSTTETAQATNDLSRAAEELQVLVGRFKLEASRDTRRAA